MRILALVPGGISDQLLFFPTLDTIKQKYPKAEIGVVAEPKAIAAYRVSKLVDTVIPFAFSGTKSPSDWANLLGIIRDREYEVALCSDTSWSVGLMLWLSGVPTRITYSTTSAPWFYTGTVPDKAKDSPCYQVDRYHDLLSALGISGPAPEITINLPESDIAWAEAVRDRMNLSKGYVLMYPGVDTGRDSKGARYPLEKWQALVSDFQAKQPDMPIVLLQTEGSAAQVNPLKRGDSQLVVVPAENTGQVAAIVAGANLVIAPDSYVMQLATALKVFTLALFGNNKPEEMLPPIAGDETRYLGIASETQQISDIAPETVLQKVWGA